MTIQVSTVPEAENLGIQPRVDRATYLADLLRLRHPLDGALSWLQSIRDRATARVEELAIPSTREEEWRFTDLSALLEITFQAPVSPIADVALADIQPFILPEATGSRLVFVDGIYAPALSSTANLPPAIVETLGSSSTQAIQPYLAAQPGAEETFTALNTASLTDAAIVRVAKNQVVEAPIHLLFVASAGPVAAIAQPRCLVIAEANSHVVLVEEYVALGTGTYFTNAVTEIFLGNNASVSHSRIQREGSAAFHIGKTAVSQERDSRYLGNAISLGGKLSRHNLDVFQTGEQTRTELNGLTLITGNQVADTHSAIAYAHPYGSSNQLHKCIVDERAHAVFNGRISVPRAAQLTDARQLSKNLLLSPKARVDTKPQLEIVADNVKCAHGATVSQLENDEVFYLQSRGIDKESACKLLIYAFAYEVISQIPVLSLRDQLSELVRFQHGPQA